MGFYDLQKDERQALVNRMQSTILEELQSNKLNNTLSFFANEDTYIRKAAYLAIGKLYVQVPEIQIQIIQTLNNWIQHPNFHIRQTTINAAGEIGKKWFEIMEDLFDIGLKDKHHIPRYAFIGAILKNGRGKS